MAQFDRSDAQRLRRSVCVGARACMAWLLATFWGTASTT